MGKTWTNGQLQAKTEILSSLSSKKDITVVCGASGAGKSEVISDVLENLKQKSEKIFEVRCTESTRYINYRAIDVGICNKVAGTFRAKLTDPLINIAKDIPFLGNTISSALIGLQKFPDMKLQSARVVSLDPKVEELLAILNREVDSSNAVFVFKESQWLDRETLNLIAMIKRDQLDQDFPCLQRTKFLLSISPELLEIPLEEYCDIIGAKYDGVINVQNMDKSEFEVLWSNVANNHPLPDEVADKILALSNGSIKLINHVAEYLKATNAAEEKLGSLAPNLIKEAIEFQLKKMGNRRKELTKLLNKGALIGDCFSIMELACLSGKSIKDVESELAYVKNLKIIEGSENALSFTNSLVHSFFQDTARRESQINYEKFAQCLLSLRPHEYETRGIYLLKAGQTEKGVELLVLSVLRSIRAGEAINSEIDKIIRTSCPAIVIYYEKLREAFYLYNIGKFKDSVSICDEISNCMYGKLSAEANLLLARIGTTTLGHIPRSMVISKIESAYNNIEKEEIELKFRAGMIKLIYYAYEGREVDAKLIAIKLYNMLRERLKFDSHSNLLLQLLRSHSDLYLNDEIARAELKHAIQQLVPDGVPSITRPTLAFVVLINISGNALQTGRFECAAKWSKLADDIVKEHAGITFPRLDMLVSNQIISAWHLESADKVCILEQYESLTREHSDSGDIWLLKSNLSAMYLSLSMLDKATQVLGCIDNDKLNGEEDAYFTYFLRNNQAALQYDRGNISQSKKIFKSISHLPIKLPYSIRKFMEIRHQEITNILESGTRHCMRWDDLPKESLKGKLGPIYKFFGRGLLFSDLQFWGEF